MQFFFHAISPRVWRSLLPAATRVQAHAKWCRCRCWGCCPQSTGQWRLGLQRLLELFFFEALPTLLQMSLSPSGLFDPHKILHMLSSWPTRGTKACQEFCRISAAAKLYKEFGQKKKTVHEVWRTSHKHSILVLQEKSKTLQQAFVDGPLLHGTVLWFLFTYLVPSKT